jgi:hypothetical protein
VFKNLFKKKEDWIISARRAYSHSTLLRKSGNTAKLSKQQCENIKSFWRTYNLKADLLFKQDFYSIYANSCENSDLLQYYIPDDFYYCYADTYFTNYHTSIKLDNKNLYDLYFYDVQKPKCIGRRIEGVYLDADYNPTTLKSIIVRCQNAGNIIIKSAINSDGGKGCYFVDDVHNNIDKLIEILGSNNNIVIQEIINQHDELKSFNPQSVNTVRVMTLYFDGEIHVLSSVLRMGIEGNRVDNASSGGIVCGIDKDGLLKNIAYDSKGNKYYSHPQGKKFDGVKVPAFSEIIKISERLANRFINFTKLISWDFAIAQDGTPVLIEANFTGGQLDFHQLCNGPIWGGEKLTHKILTELFSQSDDIKNVVAK